MEQPHYMAGIVIATRQAVSLNRFSAITYKANIGKADIKMNELEIQETLESASSVVDEVGLCYAKELY